MLSSGSETQISVIIENYGYSDGDIIEVYINGLYASEGVDYTLTMSGSTPVITPVATEAGTVININVYKARIGWIALETSAGALVVTNDDAEISL